MDEKVFRWALGIFLCLAGLLAAAAFAYMIMRIPELRSEAAGAWVQALGSIAAIAASVALVNMQHRHEKQAEEKRKQERRINLVFMAVLAGEELVEALLELKSLADNQDVPADETLLFSAERFSHIYQSLDALPLEDMHIMDAQSAAMFRTMASRTGAMAKIAANSPSKDMAAVSEIVKSNLAVTKKLTVYLRGRYKGLAGVDIPH